MTFDSRRDGPQELWGPRQPQQPYQGQWPPPQPQAGWQQQPPQYQQPQYQAPGHRQPPRRRRGPGKIIAAAIGGFFLLIVIIAVAANSGSKPPAPASTPAAGVTTAAAAGGGGTTITYKVTGSTADVTYGPAGSDLAGHAGMDKTIKITGKPAVYYSITAQLQGGGKVTCEILVNGQVTSKSTASGGYNLANCEVMQDPFSGKWQDANSGA